MNTGATNTESVCVNSSVGAQSYTVYFDILRIIAAFAVVMIHVSVYPWKASAVTSSDWTAANFYDSLSRFAVPVFVMISGALFLGNKRSVSQLYQKSILRIAIAFLFWSVAYAIATYLYQANMENAHWNWQEFLSAVIKGHYHLWFLPMIMGLYMIVPLLQKILESESLTKYLLTLSVVLGVILPQFLAILPLFSLELGKAASALWKNFYLSTGYISYFLLGFILHRKSLSPKAERILYLLGGCGLMATFALTAIVSIWKGTPKSLFYESLTVNVFLYSIAVFVGMRNHCPVTIGGAGAKFWRILSKCSFGAYLVHIWVLALWYKCLGGRLSPWVEIPFFTVVVFAISMLLSWSMSKIPYLGKYIV